MAEAPAATPTIEERVEALFAPDEELPQEETLEAPAPVVEGDDNPAPDKPALPLEDYEFEFGGAKYQVPKELKELHEGYLRTQDYTVKNQEVADMRRVTEATLAQAREWNEMQSALAPHLEQLALVNNHLRQFQNTDWNKLTTENPVEAQRQFINYQQVKDFQKQAEQAVQKAAGDHRTKINEHRQKILAEGTKILEKRIQGWNPERASELGDYAKSKLGFTDVEVQNLLDPRLVEAFYKASKWDALQDSKPAVANKASASAVKTLKARASESGDAAEKQQSELRRDIRNAKTDVAKSKGIQRLLESKFRDA